MVHSHFCSGRNDRLQGGLQAGMTDKQQLPESFKVTRSAINDAPQDVFINRQINLDSWLLQGKVSSTLAAPHQAAGGNYLSFHEQYGSCIGFAENVEAVKY